VWPLYGPVFAPRAVDGQVLIAVGVVPAQQPGEVRRAGGAREREIHAVELTVGDAGRRVIPLTAHHPRQVSPRERQSQARPLTGGRRAEAAADPADRGRQAIPALEAATDDQLAALERGTGRGIGQAGERMERCRSRPERPARGNRPGGRGLLGGGRSHAEDGGCDGNGSEQHASDPVHEPLP
jgi:hypothetical protein